MLIIEMILNVENWDTIIWGGAITALEGIAFLIFSNTKVKEENETNEVEGSEYNDKREYVKKELKKLISKNEYEKIFDIILYKAEISEPNINQLKEEFIQNIKDSQYNGRLKACINGLIKDEVNVNKIYDILEKDNPPLPKPKDSREKYKTMIIALVILIIIALTIYFSFFNNHPILFRGVVKDPSSQTPLAGVEVIIKNTKPETKTISDSQGTFSQQFTPISKDDTLSIILKKEGYVTVDTNMKFKDTFEFEMRKIKTTTNKTYYGKVIDNGGKPAERIKVKISLPDSTIDTVTDKDGNFEITLPNHVTSIIKVTIEETNKYKKFERDINLGQPGSIPIILKEKVSPPTTESFKIQVTEGGSSASNANLNVYGIKGNNQVPITVQKNRNNDGFNFSTERNQYQSFKIVCTLNEQKKDTTILVHDIPNNKVIPIDFRKRCRAVIINIFHTNSENQQAFEDIKNLLLSNCNLFEVNYREFDSGADPNTIKYNGQTSNNEIIDYIIDILKNKGINLIKKPHTRNSNSNIVSIYLPN